MVMQNIYFFLVAAIYIFICIAYFKKSIIAKTLSAIGIIFIIPIFIDAFIFENKIESNLSNSEWSSFLGAYLGSLVTVIGTFLAIKYQFITIGRLKKDEKIINIKNLIKTINDINIEKIYNENYEIPLIASSHKSQNSYEMNSGALFLIEFPKNFYQDNINELIEISLKEKGIIENLVMLTSDIENLNANRHIEFKFIDRRYEFMKAIYSYKNKKDKKPLVKKLCEVIENAEFMIRHYRNYLTVGDIKDQPSLIKFHLNRLKESHKKYIKELGKKERKKFERSALIIEKFVSKDEENDNKVEYYLNLIKFYIDGIYEFYKLTGTKNSNIFEDDYFNLKKNLGTVTKIRKLSEELNKKLN